jgi:hypothetical protein
VFERSDCDVAPAHLQAEADLVDIGVHDHNFSLPVGLIL